MDDWGEPDEDSRKKVDKEKREKLAEPDNSKAEKDGF